MVMDPIIGSGHAYMDEPDPKTNTNSNKLKHKNHNCSDVIHYMLNCQVTCWYYTRVKGADKKAEVVDDTKVISRENEHTNRQERSFLQGLYFKAI